MIYDHRTFTSSLALALALGLGSIAAAPARADDEKKEEAKAETGTDSVVVNLKDGKQQTRKGEIVEETAGKVVLKAGADGKTSTIKREEIARVEYGGQPVAMIKGDLAVNRNDFDAAAKAYLEAAGAARPIWKPRALLGAGRALALAGKFDEAAAQFEAAAKAGPTWIWARDAYREGVRALIRAKNPSKALAMANEAPKAYEGAEFKDEALDEAKLLKAEALEAGGQAGDARSIYNVLTNSKDARVRGRALLGAARAAGLANDKSRAESQFRAILDDKDVERSVRCGAARGLGESLLKTPGIEKEYVKLRGVAEVFAKALAVHFPGRGEPTEDREASLHQGAIVYDMLADLCKDPKDARAAEQWRGNARALREELLRLYKTSPLCAENQKKLAQVGPAPEAPKTMKGAKDAK